MSAARGGDLGEWTRGSMDAAFDSAAFALPLNTVSQPVRSSVRLPSDRGHQPEGHQGQGPAHPRPDRGRGRAPRSARRRGRQPGEAGARSKSDPAALDTVARALKLKVGRTMPVQEGTRVQLGTLVVPDAGVWAFTAKPGQTGPVVETRAGVSTCSGSTASSPPACRRWPTSARRWPARPGTPRSWREARKVGERLRQADRGRRQPRRRRRFAQAAATRSSARSRGSIRR